MHFTCIKETEYSIVLANLHVTSVTSKGPCPRNRSSQQDRFALPCVNVPYNFYGLLCLSKCILVFEVSLPLR
jgi:hypothetical protein